MAYTSHGHHIEGTNKEDLSARPSFVDCLGPRVCMPCFIEASNIVRLNHSPVDSKVSTYDIYT